MGGCYQHINIFKSVPNLSLYRRNGRPRLVEYRPRENPGEGFGVAFHPILEIAGAAAEKDISFPPSYCLETELCMALRSALPLSTVAVEDFEETWIADKCPDVNGAIDPATIWPVPGKNMAGQTKKKPANKPGNNTNFLHNYKLKLSGGKRTNQVRQVRRGPRVLRGLPCTRVCPSRPAGSSCSVGQQLAGLQIL